MKVCFCQEKTLHHYYEILHQYCNTTSKLFHTASKLTVLRYYVKTKIQQHQKL